MAISRKGKRPITVDDEELLWRYWNGGVHIVDLQGRLNLYSVGGRALVKGPRFRAVPGCGGLHRCFRCPDFFWVLSGPKQVAACIRWAIRRGPTPTELDRSEFRMSPRAPRRPARRRSTSSAR